MVPQVDVGEVVVNVVVFGRRVVDDPVREETAKGVVVGFRLAVDRAPRLWIDAEAWGHLAGGVHRHVTAGRMLVVCGPLRCSEWLSSSGEKRSRWLVAADRITFLGGRVPDAGTSGEDPVAAATV